MKKIVIATVIEDNELSGAEAFVVEAPSEGTLRQMTEVLWRTKVIEFLREEGWEPIAFPKIIGKPQQWEDVSDTELQACLYRVNSESQTVYFEWKEVDYHAVTVEVVRE